MAYLVCYPQTVSTSFLLTTFLLLTSVHLAKPQISISGACQTRCDAMRQKGNRDAFKSDCRNQDECTRDCESCPKQVCDETTSSTSYFQWHCPAAPEISKECKDLCNKFRDKGNPEKKTVYCNNLDTSEDQDQCKNECDKCPKFVCDSAPNSALHCPWDQFEGDCKLECDKARVRDLDSSFISHVGEIRFFCSEVHKGSSNAEQLCLSTLRHHCPAYVQDEDNSDKYNCPSATDADLSGECRKFCDKYTDEQEKTVDCIYTFMYNFPYDDMARAKAKCKTLCQSCKTPEGVNYVCDPANVQYFHCPKDAPKRGEPLPKTKRSYKGPCKHKCDVSQGGGPQAFSLYCDKFYETPEERKRCVQVCTEECGERDCRYDDQRNEAIILCRGDEQKQKQLRNEEKRKADQWLEENRRLTPIAIAIDELIIILVLIGILMAILVIVFICSCWCNRKKMKGLQQQPNGQFGQIPAGQVPGQMATNPSVGLMGSGGQGPRQPSSPFSTGPTPIGGQQTMQVGSGVQGQAPMPPPTVGMWESK